MKRKPILSSFIVFIILIQIGCTTPSTYLDQTVAGLEPELFANGIVNTDAVELNAVFNKQMDEFFFTRIIGDDFVIHHSVWEDETWSDPTPIEMFEDMSGPTMAADMTVSADGKTMYLLGKSVTDNNPDIYKSEKVDGQWQWATKVEFGISSDEFPEYYPVMVGDGSLYFISLRNEASDIYRAQYKGNGEFDAPVNVGPENGSGDTFVTADEKYMITNWGSGEQSGLHISENKDGEWQTPVYLGDKINTEHTDFCPYMSPDGKYFFFSRRISDPPGSGWQGVTKGEVYWMDAKAIMDKLYP